MRFRKHLELEHGLRQVDIAPLINIFFLLLIFFMLTTSLLMQPAIKVNLPKTVISKALKVEDVQIVISAENVVYVDGNVVTLQELKTLLKQVAESGASVLIKSDKRSSLGKQVEIWDMCRDLGVAQINIATNQE